MAVLIWLAIFLIKVLAYITKVGFHLRMLTLSIYLCRTDFEFETEFEIEFEIFCEFQPSHTASLSNNEPSCYN